MKKLMMAMAAAAMVGAAHAEATYDYIYNVYVLNYEEKDSDPCDDHAGWYKCYGMTQATAKELLGMSKTVMYSDVADWLRKNFADNSAAVVDQSQAFSADGGYYEFEEYGQYYFNGGNGSFGSTDDYIGVVLFDNGTDLAFNVLSAVNEKSTFFRFDDQGGSSSSGWIAVPEPTSGLLMLLGMAGLALKRKRA